MTIMRTIDAVAVIETHTSEHGDLEIKPTEISYSTSRYDSAAELSISGLPRGNPEVVGSYPEQSSVNTPTTVLCWATNDRGNADDDRPGSIIAGGELVDGAVDEEGVWSGTVVDAVRKLRQTTFSGDYYREGVTTIAEDILNNAGLTEAVREPGSGGGTGITGTAQYVTRTPSAEEDRSASARRITGGSAKLYSTTVEFTETPSFEALTEVLDDSNWWWWCRPDNTLVVDTQLPTETHELPYILETSAGKQTPPWQAVEVIGERQGTRSAPAGVQDGEEVIGTQSPIRATSGDGEPVFTRVDRSIQSFEKAQAVANSIFRELRTQQKGGTVTALGDEELRPLDSIKLPDHMGGESYLVSELTHTISSDEGFITEIECGGLLDPGADGELSTEEPPPEGSSSGFGSSFDQGTAATPDDG